MEDNGFGGWLDSPTGERSQLSTLLLPALLCVSAPGLFARFKTAAVDGLFQPISPSSITLKSFS
jgi:hypothetical protein